MNKRKQLAELFRQFAESEDAYFEFNAEPAYDNFPVEESDLRYWRVVIPPKEKWRDKLFKGCPVYYLNTMTIDSYFAGTKRLFKLPLIEESPRNVWLCPPDEIPEIHGLNIIFRNAINNTWGYDYDEKISEDEWRSVTAFMILEDLK